MNCPRCNNEIGENDAFCKFCGANINSEVVSTIEDSTQIVEELVELTKKEKTKKFVKNSIKNKKIIIPTIIVIVAIVVGMIVLIANKSKKNDDIYNYQASYYADSYNDYDYNSNTLSEDDIESVVVSALCEALEDKNKDPDLAKYKIGSIKKNNDYWTVYGTYYMYTSYGNFAYDGTFETSISEYGSVQYFYLH